ncbi:tubulin polyglutamylase ttll6 [Latimeria chalumnae]|uniref:tubulin polyglutamylase ttll6 n=1 Tax=Latimeria chalumnae TaxID=7897 RepID=UPI00313C2EE2
MVTTPTYNKNNHLTMNNPPVNVRRAARSCGLREAGENEEWTLYWTDYSVSLDRVMEMKRYQKINHFPGMSEICRKDLLARNMNRMLKLFPKEYKIFPRTWCLPADYSDLQAYSRSKKPKTYICKPDSGCQGRGIFVTKSLKDIKPEEDMICQVYISKPFVIDGFKFDLRIYVLITSCDPLRIFIYKEGLARFATTKYCDPTHSNVGDICMHLTNYAINKHSNNFIRDEESGSKRKFSAFNEYMEKHGYDLPQLWADIEDVIIKTLVAAHPVLKHNYLTCFPNHTSGSACFEILGFDILIDRKLKPWLLEVNHSPSFTTDSQLDREVKDGLLHNTLILINLGACDRKKIIEEEKRRVKERLLQQCRPRAVRAEESRSSQVAWLEQAERYEDKNLGGFRRIYPAADSEKYDKFFKHSSSILQETIASKAREECTRHQLQEFRLKQEEKELVLKGLKKDLQGESAGDRARNQNPKCKPAWKGATNIPSNIQERDTEVNRGIPCRIQDIAVNVGVSPVGTMLQVWDTPANRGVTTVPSRIQERDTTVNVRVSPITTILRLWDTPINRDTTTIPSRIQERDTAVSVRGSSISSMVQERETSVSSEAATIPARIEEQDPPGSVGVSPISTTKQEGETSATNGDSSMSTTIQIDIPASRGVTTIPAIIQEQDPSVAMGVSLVPKIQVRYTCLRRSFSSTQHDTGKRHTCLWGASPSIKVKMTPYRSY